MVRIQNRDNYLRNQSCDLYLRGIIDGYNTEKQRILNKRRENEKKEEKEKMIKEEVRKEIEVVTKKWKEIVSEREEITEKEL